MPVSDGSMTEITLILDKELQMEAINKNMAESSSSDLNGVLAINEDPIVSIDVIGAPASSIYDSTLSNVYGKMVRIVSWYDNESGYSNRLLELSKKVS